MASFTEFGLAQGWVKGYFLAKVDGQQVNIPALPYFRLNLRRDAGG